MSNVAIHNGRSTSTRDVALAPTIAVQPIVASTPKGRSGEGQVGHSAWTLTVRSRQLTSLVLDPHGSIRNDVFVLKKYLI
jgi:hypothetical protein